MLYINHKKSAKTALASIVILLITLVLISNKIYSDIRGEFAKRPTGLPPEPAAVVDYLKEDYSNYRAKSSTLCFPGKIISVNLSQLGAKPTFFEAINQALNNAGMGGFTSSDFLGPAPDGVVTPGFFPSANSVQPGSDSGNMYYSTNNIEIYPAGSQINFQLTYSKSQFSCANPPGAFTTSLCQVLSACGAELNISGLSNYKISGCLITSQSIRNLDNISSSTSELNTIEVLIKNIPRRQPYFVNPAVGTETHYALLANTSGSIYIGCNGDSNFSTACGITGGGALDQNKHVLLPILNSTGSMYESKAARSDYRLAFKINTCPNG